MWIVTMYSRGWLWFHQPLYLTIKWKLHQVQAEAHHSRPRPGSYGLLGWIVCFNDLLYYKSSYPLGLLDTAWIHGVSASFRRHPGCGVCGGIHGPPLVSGFGWKLSSQIHLCCHLGRSKPTSHPAMHNAAAVTNHCRWQSFGKSFAGSFAVRVSRHFSHPKKFPYHRHLENSGSDGWDPRRRRFILLFFR